MTHATTKRHVFSFDGGEQLTTIGATFFVSYLYCKYVDPNHRNWDSIDTKTSRISALNRAEGHHRAWLEHIGDMNDSNLNKNTLNLAGTVVKKMARDILKTL